MNERMNEYIVFMTKEVTRNCGALKEIRMPIPLLHAPPNLET